ncbi:hypothetical protein VTK73DRAFT_7667 [Phialemonium thermophilum]|uniref:Nucleoporin Nup159/Nup146 N-terminal domain-containing protein n=1 Tax=Phialemonium thermophilum TaxID=223376 RepID=A0ABR3Y847_9PEZI
MAFSFSNSSNAMMGGQSNSNGELIEGPGLEVIQTEGLGFLSIAGDAKVQLTPQWSPPPAPTSSLMSIASRRGLVAAAGPDAVYIATTESVRKAFKGPKNGDSEVRPFQSEAKVSLPMRISHLAFTADEKYLVLSAETGGGLAIYDVESLSQGSTQAAFELNTNGETLRQLAPNPMPELSAFCAVVTHNGNLLMANLQDRTFITGSAGSALRAQVSCVSWSTKGKQLVAGGADGTIHQMTPDGTEKGHIPKPPSVGDGHVASLTWLENHVFLAVHNFTDNQNPSVYHIITRQQSPGAPRPAFSFQKLTDPVEPFGSDRVPHYSILRIRHFPPNLDDLLIVSSTATDSIGLLSRSKTPLDTTKPAEKITNVFTTTELADDSKRAQLPMSEDLMDTYPIGVALDLSSKDKVYKPIPTDEIEESPGPLPGLWVLNNEGVLASWWLVYNESIRSGTTYPGLAANQGQEAQQSATSSISAPAPFGSPQGATSAFGSAATLGQKSSPWTTTATAPTTSAFGTSAFGSSHGLGAPKFGSPSFGATAFGTKPAAPAFGQSSMLGSLGPRPSPWAAKSTAAVTPAFGQSSFSSSSVAPSGKVFGSSVSPASQPSSGGFAGFANKGGFGAVGTSGQAQSIFSKPAPGLQSTTPEVSMDTDTAFPPPNSKPPSGSAFGSSPFVLGTTFKADPKTANDNEQSKPGDGNSLFGSAFGLSLDSSDKAVPSIESKDEDMDVATPATAEEKPKSIFSVESTTPTTTPAANKFGFKTTPGLSGGSGLFGSNSTPPGFGLFAPKAPATQTARSQAPTESPSVKEEPKEEQESLAKVPEAPLPPDTTITSKPLSKVSDDAPLPPDFISKPSSAPAGASEVPLPSFSPKKAESADRMDDKGKAMERTDTSDIAKPSVESSQPPTLETKESSTVAPAPVSNDFASAGSRLRAEQSAIPASPENSESNVPSERDEDEEDGTEEVVEGEEEEEEEDRTTDVASEGSGVDVAKDLSPSTVGADSRTPGFTPQSSFAGMAGSTFSSFSRPEPNMQTRPLFGEVSRNAPPLFPKPMPPSPRSPSPVRGAVPPTLLRPEQSRSISAPGMASQILGRKPAGQQPSQSPFGQISRSNLSVDPNVEQQRRLQVKRETEAAKVLVDPEDEGIQQILNSEIEPTTTLAEFVAVDSLLPAVKGSEIERGCELLWRDINRMVDHLGLNSRSLQGFIAGHSLKKHGKRTKEDLEDPDSWVLVEADDLEQIVELQLRQELEEGQIQDVGEVQEAIQSLSRDLAKLRAKEEDMRRIIMSQVDPDQAGVAKILPLSAEQAAQQNELRRAYANFSTLLAEAEESLTLLRAKIATAGNTSGKATMPTVEAVIRTITKMTTMAEKRSGDVDVLENQIRKLRLDTSSPGPARSRSREGSPFVGGRSTPPGLASARRSFLLSQETNFRHSLASSVGSYGGVGMRGTPPRRKMNAFSEEEKSLAQEKKAKRKSTLALLRQSLAHSGPNVSRLADDD